MLKELHIRQFALVDEITIEFEKGLNILTGETGAGKSLVLHAIELLLGGRAVGEEIQTGKESAIIEGVLA